MVSGERLISERAICVLMLTLSIGMSSFNSTRASSSVTGTLQNYNGASQRWRDIAENVYLGSYQTSFSYSHANVRVTYEEGGSSFIGTFDATGLKPNFAYQLKLEGKPTDDPISDQHLRDAGRTYSDGGLSVGYVVFDYVVTDRNGNAHKQFHLDSSYHVLWKVSQRFPLTGDSSPVSYVVQGSPSDATGAYANPVGPTDVQIYAEWQSDRPTPGNVQLPPGTYDVKFIITEESFHSPQGDPTGGYWSTVMGCDVSFLCGPATVIPEAPYGTSMILLGMFLAFAGFKWLHLHVMGTHSFHFDIIESPLKYGSRQIERSLMQKL